MNQKNVEKVWCNFDAKCPSCRLLVFVDDANTLPDGRAAADSEIRCLNCERTGSVVLRDNAGSTVKWNRKKVTKERPG